MKKTLPLLLIMIFSGSLMAQYCGFSGAGTPDTNFSGVVSSYNNFPCIKRGVAFNSSFDIRVPENYTTIGLSFPVISVSLDTLGNLPCNLCWSTDVRGLWLPDEVHCVDVQGTTFDSVGLYKLYIAGTATALFNGSPQSIPGTFDELGAQFYVRVIEPTDLCPALIVQPGDTSHTRIACGTTPAICPATIPVNITAAVGLPCNYSEITYTIPAGYTNPVWTFSDTSYYVLDSTLTAESTAFATSTIASNTLQATDSNGCTILMNYIVPTNTGLYLAPHICIATLDSSVGHNVIVWNRDDDNYDATITRYNLYYSIDDSMPHPGTLLGSLGYDSLAFFTDTVNVPLSGVIKYELRMQDTCGTEIVAKDVFAPPLLRIDTANGIATLKWNFIDNGDYNLLQSTTTRLWRSTDSVNWTQIPVGVNNLVGDIYGLSQIVITDTMPVNNQVVYMVEILMPSNCLPSVARSSNEYNSVFSNRVTPGTKAPAIINSLQQIATNGRLNIYPNPGNNFVTINTAGLLGTITDLSVYDITGRKVLALFQAVNADAFSPHFYVGNLSTGAYIIKLETTEGNFAHVWLKQ